MLKELALCFVLLWTFGSSATIDDCPDTVPRDKFTTVFNGKCYNIDVDISKEFSKAHEYCKSRGGNLAMLKTKEINGFVTKFLKSINVHGFVWIGLNDIDDENEFQWVDGSSLSKYSNWANEDEGPRSGFFKFQHHFEDCVALDVDGNGKWRDFNCAGFVFDFILNAQKQFVCEYPVVNKIKTTTGPKCQTLTCTNNCGSDGFKIDPKTGCATCECDSKITTHRPETTTRFQCEPLSCSKDCSMDGFKTDPTTGCAICECDTE